MPKKSLAPEPSSNSSRRSRQTAWARARAWVVAPQSPSRSSSSSSRACCTTPCCSNMTYCTASCCRRTSCCNSSSRSRRALVRVWVGRLFPGVARRMTGATNGRGYHCVLHVAAVRCAWQTEQDACVTAGCDFWLFRTCGLCRGVYTEEVYVRRVVTEVYELTCRT